MEHLVTIDRGASLAFDHTPFSIAFEGARGPRAPFSPERTVVPPPDTNPEEEESLAGALERQGATGSVTVRIIGRRVDLTVRINPLMSDASQLWCRR